MKKYATYGKSAHYFSIDDTFYAATSVTIALTNMSTGAAIGTSSAACTKIVGTTGYQRWQWLSSAFSSQPTVWTPIYYLMTADTGETRDGNVDVGDEEDIVRLNLDAKASDILDDTSRIPATPASQGDVTGGTATTAANITAAQTAINANTDAEIATLTVILNAVKAKTDIIEQLREGNCRAKLIIATVANPTRKCSVGSYERIEYEYKNDLDDFTGTATQTLWFWYSTLGDLQAAELKGET